MALVSTSHSRVRSRGFLFLTVPGVLLAFCIAAGLVASSSAVSAQEEEWEVLRLHAEYSIQPDGVVEVTEEIDVDFRNLPSRGIFRDFARRDDCPEPDPDYPRIHECPEDHQREWHYEIASVTDDDGTRLRWEDETSGDLYRVRIGDPDEQVIGEQQYRLEYTIEGALDAYQDTDELFWNAIGEWPVRIRDASVRVELPGESPVQSECWQGFPGSDQTCETSVETDGPRSAATYSSIGMVEPGEWLTVALEWEKGLVDVPPPSTTRPFSVHDLYTLDVIEFAGAIAVAILGIAGLGRTWWQFGRDRRYTTIQYLTDDPEEETRPLFQRHPIVVEYTPPMDLRPGQMGLVQDERADTIDISATIVDLAVRGYLTIEEIPKRGWFGKTDWTLRRTGESDENELLPYEARLLQALFEGRGNEVKVSQLKNRFARRLQSVQDLLYRDGTERGWFAGNPKTMKALWGGIGFGVVVVGVGAAAATGYFLGRVLIGAPIAVAGLLLMVIAGNMSRRTATGSEVRRRVKGFELFIETAEKHRQEFNEEENIFARYLPYAMVFGCVKKWAKAFEGLDQLERNARRSVSPWYVGATAFNVRSFDRSMRGFSSNVSSTLASKPKSSGSSGFRGGGGAGRGGGGGGGGRW